MNTVSKKLAKQAAGEAAARKNLSQQDVPAFSLDQALRVPTAISDSLGKAPSKPLRVAQAMNLSPTSSGFRQLCGSSIAYGLTEGGYNAEQISLTPLARRIVAPTKEGDDFAARREASLRPRVIRDFLTRYSGSKLPAEPIGRNVLEEIGVPGDRTAAVYGLIVESARAVGFLRDVKGHAYVDLDHAEAPPILPEEQDGASDPPTAVPIPALEHLPSPVLQAGRKNRIFITHGKNQEIVSQLKELLTFGGFTPVVALDNETASKPVPDKVLDDMRTCEAAVIHVGSEVNPDNASHRIINQNVLIEIGVAMALYGRKFILLAEKNTSLPSNLQGLYLVKFEGGRLDYESTMKLLKAFNDFRS